MGKAARHSPDVIELDLKRGRQLGSALRDAYASVLNEPCPQHLLDELRLKEKSNQDKQTS